MYKDHLQSLYLFVCLFFLFCLSVSLCPVQARNSRTEEYKRTDRSIYCIGHLKGIHSFSCSNMLLFGSVSFVLKIKIIVSF